MKVQIQLEGEGLAALNNVVGSASFNSRVDARKIHTLANWLVEPMAKYKKALEAIQDEYGEEVIEDVGVKAKKKMVVPEDKIKAYQAAVEAARLVKYQVQFDKESFALAGRIMDELFERKEIKEQNGLSGIDQARNINQICVAFDESVEV